MTLDPLVQLFLLVGVFNPFFFNKTLANLQVTLPLLQVFHFDIAFFVLPQLHQTKLLAEHLQGGLLVQNVVIDSLCLGLPFMHTFVVKLKELARV